MNKEASESKLNDLLRAHLKSGMEKKYGENLPNFEALLNANSGDLQPEPEISNT